MEDITYADLKFQDSAEQGQRRGSGSSEKRGLSAAPRASQHRLPQITLVILCLLLLIGLVAVSVLFLQVSERHASLEAKNQNLTRTFQDMRRSLCLKSENTSGAGCRLCPPNWIQHEEKCYNISTEELDWTKSRARCSSHNARLLVVESRKEWDFIYTTIKVTYDYFWTGLTDAATEGTWTREDNTTFSTDVISIEDNRETYNCAVLGGYYSTTKYTFSAKRCDESFRFICETDAVELADM